MPSTTSVGIKSLNDATDPSVEFAATQYRVNDTETQIKLRVRLSGSASDAVDVPFTVTPSTAISGTDFDLLTGGNVAGTATSGTVTIPLGATSADLSFRIKHAPTTTPERAKRFSVQLGTPSGAALFSQTSTTVTIVNRAASDGVIEIQYPTYTCDSDCGAVTVKVIRSGTGAQISGSTRVIVTTEDGTASGAAYDSSGLSGHPQFAGLRQALVFAPYERIKTASVRVINGASGTFLTRIESIDRLLSSGTVATKAAIGARDRAVVTIVNQNTVANGLDFDQPKYDVNDTGGWMSLTVRRLGTNQQWISTETLKVDYVIAGGTTSGLAAPGVDYTPLATGGTGTLAFGAGQLTAQIWVKIANRPQVSSRRFTAKLSNPRDETNAGNTVTLLNNNPVEVTIRGTTGRYGYFEFDRAVYNALSEDGSVYVMLVRKGDLTHSATVEVRTGDVSAVAGRNYQERAGLVTFAPGEAHTQIAIGVSSTSATTSFVMGLYPTATGATGALDLTTVNITPGSILTGPAIEFETTSLGVDDIQRYVQAKISSRVQLSGSDRVVIPVSTYVPNPRATESAIPGVDFTPLTTNVVLTPASQTATVTVRLGYHASTLSKRIFYLQLGYPVNSGDPSRPASLLSKTNLPVSILNVYQANNGTFGFAFDAIRGSRANGSVTIRIYRYGNTSSSAYVVLLIASGYGTAVPGQDFAKGTSTAYPQIGVAFAAGQNSVDVSLALNQMPSGTGDRTALLELASPTTGANNSVVGNRSYSVLTIVQ